MSAICVASPSATSALESCRSAHLNSVAEAHDFHFHHHRKNNTLSTRHLPSHASLSRPPETHIMAQRFMELVRGAASRAVMQRSASSSAQPAAPQDELICQPQSHAMQRSIELLPYPETDNTPSPSSDEGFSSTSTAGMEATPSPSYHSLSPHCGTQGLHSPLDINDDRLLGMPPLPTFSHVVLTR